ncbi:MAG: Ig-like domain-containing protein, partial [Pseudohongiella sp.]
LKQWPLNLAVALFRAVALNPATALPPAAALVAVMALPLTVLAQNGTLPEDMQNIGTFDGRTGIYQTCVIADGIGEGFWNVQLRGAEMPGVGPDMFSLELIAATETQFDECGTVFDPDTGEFLGLVFASNVGAEFDDRTFLFQALINPDAPGFQFLTNLTEDFVDVSAPDENMSVTVQFADRGAFTDQPQIYTLSQRPDSLTLSAPVCQATLGSDSAAVNLPVSLDITASGLSISRSDNAMQVATGSLTTGSYALSARCQAMFGDQIYTSGSASVLLTISPDVVPEPANVAPSFTKGGDQSVAEDASAQSISNWATNLSAGPARESGQTLSFNISNNNNALFATQPAVASDGTLTYTPAANANGSATVTVNVRDNGGTGNGGIDTSANQTFTITVNAVNDAPLLTEQSVTVDEDSGEFTGTVASPGVGESGQSLTATVTGNSNASLFAAAPAIDADGSLSFTPADNASGEAEITLELSDDGGTDQGGVDSATVTLTITVNAINDAPVISATLSKTSDISVTTPRSADADFDLLGPDKARTVTYAAFIDSTSGGPKEGSQTVTLSVVDVDNVLTSAGTINEDGDLTLAFSDAIGDGPVTIEIHATDDGGTDNGGTNTAVLPLKIIPSEPSVVQSRYLKGRENQRCIAVSLRPTYFKGVKDPDNASPYFRFVIKTLPAKGTLLTPDLETEVTEDSIWEQKEFCFVPPKYDFSEPGEVYASFTYVGLDDFDIPSESTATVEIEVEGIF